MTPQIKVTHNLNTALIAYADLPEKMISQATPRALNSTATTVRAEAARRVGKTYNIKVGAAKGQMRIDKAWKGRLLAKVVVSGRPIPVIAFDSKQTAGGVSVKIKNGRKVLKHTFIAKMPGGGHVGVFERTGRFTNTPRMGRYKGIKLGGKGREIIKELFSLSLPVAFTQKQIMDALMQVAAARFQETLRQEMRFVQLKAA